MAKSITTVKNLTRSPWWKGKDYTLEDIYFTGLLTQEDKDFLKKPRVRNILKDESIRSNMDHMDSKHVVRIMRESSVTVKGRLRIPTVVMAPIGAITVEHIIAGTKKFLTSNQASHVYDPEKGGSYSNAYLVRSVIIDFILKETLSMDRLGPYEQNIATVLESMMINHWDTRKFELFISLNSFINKGILKTQFGEFLDNNQQEIADEVATFNGHGASTLHQVFLQQWINAEYSLINPYGAGKAVDNFITELQEMNFEEFTGILSTRRFNNRTKIKNTLHQVRELHSAFVSVRGLSVDTIDKVDIGRTLVPILLEKMREENAMGLDLLQDVYTAIQRFQDVSNDEDIESTTIVYYIKEHWKEMSLLSILSLLITANSPDSLLAGGNMRIGKRIVHTLLVDSRDPRDCVDFITRLVSDYRGSLPTESMWRAIIASDHANEELSMTPDIVFSISKVSKQHRSFVIDERLDELMEGYYDARKNSLPL